MVWDGINVDY